MNVKFDKNLMLSGLFALAMAAAMMLQGSPLKLPETPGGILSLEFAKTPQRVDEILLAWKYLNNTALWNTLIDFVFMLAYGLFFLRSMQFIIANGNAWWGKHKNWLLKLAWIPTLLDFIENGFILSWLLQLVPGYSPLLVYGMVMVKFVLAAMLLLAALPVWILNLFAIRHKA